MNVRMSRIIAACLTEYSQTENVQRYVRPTAGTGIDYLLHHVYGPLYERYLDLVSKQAKGDRGIRLLEYGCGGGMNLLHMVRLLAARGDVLKAAYGTDLTPAMVQAANREAKTFLSRQARGKVKFLIAPNESLLTDLAATISAPPSSLLDTFDLIAGVNTHRYSHRLNAADQCARDIFALLRPGGISIMIDMNKKFPFYRSRIWDWLTLPSEQYRLPSLAEYREPFEKAGFELLDVRNFCWIPHSAKGLRFRICRFLDPVLNRLVPAYAMRSLVVAQKPLSSSMTGA